MTIIGIDPGIHCGWAVRYGPERMDSGMWNLSGGRFEGAGMRYVRLRAYLVELLTLAQPSVVAFEEVRRHLGMDAARAYGGMVAVITEECERREIPYQGIPVGTVKKTATGKGNANKDLMIEAARKRWDIEVSHDEADARWVAEAGASVISASVLTVGGRV